MYRHHIALVLLKGNVTDLHRTVTFGEATGSPRASHHRGIRTTSARPLAAMRDAAVARCLVGSWPRTGVLLALACLGATALSACDAADPRDAASLSCPSSQPAPNPAGHDLRLSGRIVWASNRADDNFDLYMMAADGSGIRRLKRTPAMDIAPVWSPDGTKIAFTSLAGNDDSAPAWISVMNADGSALHRLTPREVGIGAPTWSPDGTRIAFQGPDGDLNVMRGDGSQRHRLPDVHGHDSWPSWSPDGRLILLTSAPRWGAEQLWTIRPDGSSPTQLSAEHGAEAVWSPDGRNVAFVSSRDGNPNARDPEDWNEEIYVMSHDGSRTTRITKIAGNDHWPPTWSPDGTHIAFTSDGCGDNSEILITDTSGSKLLNATRHPSHDFFPSWHR